MTIHFMPSTWWHPIRILLVVACVLLNVAAISHAQELVPAPTNASMPFSQEPDANVPVADVNLGNEPETLLNINPNAKLISNDGSLSTPMEFTNLVRKLATSTLAVIASCILFLFLYKRFGKGKLDIANGRGSSGIFRVVQSIRLGQRNVLQIVEAEGFRFVVGIDQTGIKSIVPISSFNDFMSEAGDVDESSNSQEQDQDLLRKLMSRGFGFSSEKTG